MSRRLTFESMRDLEQRAPVRLERLTVRQQLIESGALRPREGAAEGEPTPATSIGGGLRLDQAGACAAAAAIRHGRREPGDRNDYDPELGKLLAARRRGERRRRL